MKKVVPCLLFLPLPAISGLMASDASIQPEPLSLTSSKSVENELPTADSSGPDPFFPFAKASQRAFLPPQGTALSVELRLFANQPVPTDFGFFAGGTTLLVMVSGTVNLGPPAVTTLPDGSLAAPIPAATCTNCWAPGYQYFIPGSAYPQVAGGDGINHFPGGGGNYDSFPDGHGPWAAEGRTTTDSTDPRAIRFGEVAGTYSSNPTPNSSDWFPVGFGGTFQVPAGGGHLYLVIADTYYPNNTGSYLVSVSGISETLPGALVFTGLLLMGVRMALRPPRGTRVRIVR